MQKTLIREGISSSLSCNDQEDLFLLKNGQEKGFAILYDRYAEKLFGYVIRRVKSTSVAEEIVQELFVSLWAKRRSVLITSSLEAYLITAARYSVLTWFRSERVRKRYADHLSAFIGQRADNSVEEQADLRDLEQTINSSISFLPEKCRTVFRLSRMEHEPIARIAERMNISRRTVENYLTQALKHLRTSLGDFLAVLLAMLLSS